MPAIILAFVVIAMAIYTIACVTVALVCGMIVFCADAGARAVAAARLKLGWR